MHRRPLMTSFRTIGRASGRRPSKPESLQPVVLPSWSDVGQELDIDEGFVFCSSNHTVFARLSQRTDSRMFRAASVWSPDEWHSAMLHDHLLWLSQVFFVFHHPQSGGAIAHGTDFTPDPLRLAVQAGLRLSSELNTLRLST